MIYIEEKDYNRHIDMLSFFQRRGEYEIIIWLYEDEEVSDDICGFKISNSDTLEGQQISQSYDDIVPQKTVRIPLKKNIIEHLYNSKDILTVTCDNITLYKNGNYEFYASAIIHENMFLVDDDKLLNELKGEGFNATTNKPSWW